MLNIIKEESNKILSKTDLSQLKDKSVLITGASGLIGIFLVSSLSLVSKKLNIKISVWVGSPIEPVFENIFENCTIITGDITNIELLESIPKFDVIIHAAGYGQPGKFLDNKIKTIEINTLSTIKLLDKINFGGKFLFVSTSELYSGLDIENINENQIGITNTDHNRSCYIEGKRCGEAICFNYPKKDIDIKIVRLSLGYGPGTRKNDHRVLNSLIQKGLTNDSITLLDNGTAMRTYCYVTDVIEMFWNILMFGTHKLYNVGGISIISIYDLAVMIGNILNKNVMIPNNIKELKGSPKVVSIDITRYLTEFKKNDFISLYDGLMKTIEWQKKIYNL